MGFWNASKEELTSVLKLSDQWLLSGKGNQNDKVNTEISQRMSAAGSIIRDRGKVIKASRRCAFAFRKHKWKDSEHHR